MTEQEIQNLADKLTQRQYSEALMLAHDALDASFPVEVLAERISELMAVEYRRGINTALEFYGLKGKGDQELRRGVLSTSYDPGKVQLIRGVVIRSVEP